MGKKGVSIGIKLSVFVLFIILICSVGIGIFSYLEFHNSSIEDKKETSRLLAQSFASSIDGDLYEEIMTSQEKNEYWNQVKIMADKVKTETDMMYLYVVDANYTQDEVRYFVTGFKPGDEITRDFLENDTLDLYGVEMFETLKTGQSLTSDVYDGGIYGSMISGYAAVLNSRGSVVGVVGVDISVDEAFAASRAFLWDIAIFVLVFCVIFITAGIIFMNMVITRPLKRLSQASRKIANGEISVNFGIYSRDEIGQLSNDLIKLAENLNILTDHINETTQAHNTGNIHTLINPDGFSGAYRQVVEGINNMASQYVKDITSMLTVIRAFGMGNFNASLEDMPGEKRTINDAVEGLRKNLESVNAEVLSLVRHAESGNLSVQIDSSKFDGDWKRLALSLNSLLIAVAKPIEEASLVLEKMSEGDLNVQMTGDYEGDFGKIKLSLNKMSSNISHYISEIEISLDKAAHNDFSASIHSDFVGHFGNIKISVNRIIEHLGIVFETLGKNLKETSQGIMTDSANLAVSGSNLADNSSSQSETIEILKAKIESISEQIGEMTQNTALANELALQSKRGANEGKSQMQILLDTMDDINESSLNILKVISVIEGIAFQTNLLALNASVEAARAGTHGKGFAVVAEEVRNLATRSKNSAKDSSDLIHASIAKIKEGVRMAMETDGELNKIVNNVESVYRYIDEIAKSSEEQKFNIDDIANGIKSLHNAVFNSSASAQEVAAIAAKLSEEAEELNGLLLKMQ